MNVADIMIIVIVVALFALCIKKIINNMKCVNKGSGCAGCALSGNCHKETLKQLDILKQARKK